MMFFSAGRDGSHRIVSHESNGRRADIALWDLLLERPRGQNANCQAVG